MAATLTQARFTGPEWIFERKFDGIRLIAFKQGSEVRLYSRNRLPQNIPSVAGAIAKLPVQNLILDGEITWDRSGAYHVFDIVWLDDRDVRSLPLHERLALLRRVPLQPPLPRVASKSQHRRSPHWLKMKCEASQEFVVGGFTDPQGSRVGLGALLVGYFEDEDFAFAGQIGTGFDT